MFDKEKKISKFDIFFNSKRYPLPVKDGLMIAEDLAEDGDVTGEAERERDPEILALKMEERPLSQGLQL